MPSSDQELMRLRKLRKEDHSKMARIFRKALFALRRYQQTLDQVSELVVTYRQEIDVLQKEKQELIRKLQKQNDHSRN